MRGQQAINSIWTVIWLTTVCVTLTVLYFLVPEELRFGKFYITMGSLLVAETAIFFIPIFVVSDGNNSQDNLPIQFGTTVIVGFYSLGVLVLVLVALTPISIKILSVLHIVLFTTFLFMIS